MGACFSEGQGGRKRVGKTILLVWCISLAFRCAVGTSFEAPS